MINFKALVLALGFPIFGVGQTDWVVDANSGRPMLDVVRALRENFGWVISYEETVYDSSHLRLDGPDKALVPSVSRMFFSIPVSRLVNARNIKGPERAAIVRDIAAQHAEQGDLAFRVTPDGGHVMPTKKTELSGALPVPGDAYKSPLETPVTLQPAEAYPNLAAAIQDVVAQVAKTRGLHVAVGSMPYNVVLRTKMLFDIPAGYTARQALQNILIQIHVSSAPSEGIDSLTWNLVYDGNSRGFFFNVVSVPNSARPARVASDPDPATPPTSSGTGSRILVRP